MKPGDVKIQFGLGQAYTGIGKTRLASAAYARAAELEPGNADAWYHLGVSYLEQVEADARVLLSRHRDSAYVEMLTAETFAEQRAFIQAEEAYKKVLAFPQIPAGAHAGYGFVLLYRHNLEGAERELRAEMAANPGSLMAKLGMARLHLEQGAGEKAAREIGEIWKTDPGFARSNAWWFSAGLAGPQRGELLGALRKLQASGDIPPETETLFVDSSRENLLTERGEPGHRTPGPQGQGPRRCSKTLREAAATGDAGRNWPLARSHWQSRIYGCWLRALISVAIIRVC